jgi:PAS domain S-box-containing protein
MIVDESCVVRHVNAAAALLGGGAGTMVGKRMGEALRCRHHMESSEGCGFQRVCEHCALWQSVQETVRTGERRAGVETTMYFGSGEMAELRHLVLSTTLLPAWQPRLVLVCLEDTTSLRQAEEAWRKSAMKFSTLFRLIPDAIALTRLSDGVFLEVNEVFTRMLGRTREEVIGRSAVGDLNIWCEPGSREQWVEMLRGQGQVAGHEVKMRRGDGAIMLGAMSARVLEIDGEECVLTVLRDITEHRQIETALRESEQRLVLAQRAGRVGVFDWDIPSGMSHRTPELEVLYGRPPGSMTSRIEEWEKCVHPDDLLDVRRVLAQTFQERRSEYAQEYRIVRLDGEIRWLSTRALGTYDAAGQPLRLIGTSTDITDRKIAEEALRSNQRRLAMAMDLAHLAYWDCDYTTGTFTFNDQFYALYGTTAEREGGYQMPRKVYSQRFVHPEDRHLVFEEAARASASSDPHYQRQIEHRIIRRDGAVRHIAVRIHAIQDATGRTIRTHGINQDITARVMLEEQLRQAQKMEAIGRLAGGIAHDFRNHLTVIRGFGELLRENHVFSASDGRLLDEILKAAEQSTHLTEQLLVFSRKQTLRPKSLDMGDLTAQICAILPRLVGDDIKVRYTQEAGTARALLDPVQFQQALFNLAANARDAMPQGGELLLHLYSLAPDGSFREQHLGAEAARYVALRITDTGHGIDEATLGRIFEPFFTTKPAGKGTGLGLASVYGFVNQSGGIVDVQSQPGKGTTFILYFPQVEGAEVSAPEPVVTGQLPRGHERVLVVEDDASLCELARKILAMAGYQAEVAMDAEKALAVLEKATEGVDLLLTDVTMPGPSGVALAARARELRPGLPVVFMSAYAEKELVDRGLKESQGLFLPKPFGRQELLQMVRRALDERGR